MKQLGYKSYHYVTVAQWNNLIVQQNAPFDFLNDMPIYYRYKELDHVFPDSKFIFTTRDLDSWLNSAKELWTKQQVAIDCNTGDFGIYTKEFFGVDHYDEQAFIDAYLCHKEGVEHYFKYRPEDFLTMNLSEGDGWDELQRFLCHTGPIPSTPFPHKNRGIIRS